MRAVIVALSVLAVVGCRAAPPRLGILLDEAGVTVSRVGPAPQDIASRGILPGSWRRLEEADVVGDDRPERLVEASGGKGLELRSQTGELLAERKTSEYVTDFGVVPATATSGPLVVLYTYPNPRRGGTFTTMNGAFETLASWDELPPTGWFDAGQWKGQHALFYLQEDALVVRSPMGARLARLPAPDGRFFRTVYVQALPGDLTAVVASGSGYQPYHMVCVYRGERLVFREVQTEHAFGIARADGGVLVTTRTAQWRYALR